MVLESTIICVDNSEYMRNGDFIPSRLQAQQDAVSLVCHAKLRSNAESNVALLTLGGHPEVLTTLTTDVGRILNKLHLVRPIGDINLLSGIRIAHLALKHRQGKNHKMRIVVFVGSPVDTDEKELIKLAKKLKKEKVNVDVVNFGEEVVNTDKLSAFIKTLDGTASHLVTVPSGSMLSDALFSSPVVVGEDGTGAAGLGGSGFEFGIDPNEDPELALALRVSMEEQRQRQEEEARAASTSANQAGPSTSGADATQDSSKTTDATITAASGTEGSSSGAGASASASTSASADGGGGGASGRAPVTDEPMLRMPTEDEMLERALAMSLNQSFGGGEDSGMFDIAAMTEEEQIEYAMRMSLQADTVAASSSSSSGGNKDNSGAQQHQEQEPMDTDEQQQQQQSSDASKKSSEESKK